jgi:DNA-binding response OmpR family regulator
MSKTKIIIVEDDEVTALNLKLSLQKQGYEILNLCDNLDRAKSSIKEGNADIVIIDISLQKSNDGIALAKIVREEYKLPFIFLTSHSDDDIISQAKLTQPYGYIVKPFDPSSLHATLQMALFKYTMERTNIEDTNSTVVSQRTIEELLHSKKEADESIIRFGKDYYIDANNYEIFFKNKKIKLTKKENKFLKFLVAKLGQVVSFNQAMQYVWEENGASENSIRTLVWRLRNKLETDIIKNSSGVGYTIEE